MRTKVCRHFGSLGDFQIRGDSHEGTFICKKNVRLLQDYPAPWKSDGDLQPFKET
jgi:hypothetical protein